MGLFDRSKKVKKPLGPQQQQPQQPPPPAYSPPPQLYPEPHPPQDGPPPQPPPPPGGYLPPPPGWTGAPQYPYPGHYGPIVVNQHYYLGPPPAGGGGGGGSAVTKLNFGSVVNLATDLLPMDLPHFFNDGGPSWQPGTQLLNQGAAMYDQISTKFNNVMTLIDRDRYSGNEGDLFTYRPSAQGPGSPPTETMANVSPQKKGKNSSSRKDHPKGQTTAVAATVISGSYFAKVDLYANSRLPKNLLPLKLYVPTYPLLCLAAQYSDRVYSRPQGAERDTHVDADWRTGTKAMVIKSVPMDYMSTIVFAIRGTATFMDWAVNLNMEPTSPVGFLDDGGNFCHTGFLSVARKMIKPVAQRLRQLLDEDPARSNYSLLITGHSAGGAIASLLYSHMLSTTAEANSELRALTARFRRVHCITFGTPPVSLLPLATPDRKELRKSLFLTFLNEGDPVARADKAYVRSLLELFAAPAPVTETKESHPKPKSKASFSSTKTSKSSSSAVSSGSSRSSRKGPVWTVPPCMLSSAGRIVVLRSGAGSSSKVRGKKTVEERLNEGVVAQVATDEQLRGVVWGDPVCHVMKLYAGRIETLAVAAVTGKT